MFGSFVTKKDAPSDIDRLVVIKNLDDPKLDILRRLELWTMQGGDCGSVEVYCQSSSAIGRISRQSLRDVP